jgi:lambda repressor-like predicted transcriptional regulator
MALPRDIDGEVLCELRRRGWSLRLIAQNQGVSASTVRHHTRNVVAGVPTTKRAVRRANSLEAKALPPSEDLAYLIGVVCGDGSLWQTPRTVQLSISCDARYPELIETYVALIERVLGKAPRVTWHGENTYAEVALYSKSLPTILQLPTGKKTNDYPVGNWIWDNLGYVRGFLRGLIETDGNVYHEFRKGGWASRCRFTNKSAAIMEAFMRGTALLGYSLRRVQWDARLTVTAEVHRLARELDLKKERVYIQKGQIATPRPRGLSDAT